MLKTPTQSKNIPSLRFKGFSGGWEEKIFSDIVKINQGLQIPISKRFTEKVEDSYFYITNEFLKENSKNKYFIKNPPFSVLCNEDDLLMTRTGNTGKMVTGISGAFHNNFFKIKYNKAESDKWFLYYFLILSKTQNVISRLAGTSTIPDLNHGDFYKIEINLPSLPEQQKISNFLGSVDSLIENLKAERESFELYKKGMMQKIFSQEVRFKDEDGSEFAEWEEKKLGEVANLSTAPYFEVDRNQKDGYFLVDMGSVSIDGKLTARKRTKNIKNLLNKSDLIMPNRDIGHGDIIGKVALIDIDNLYVLGSNMYKLSISKNNLSEFIFYLINSQDINREMRRRSNGTSQLQLIRKDVDSVKVLIPSLPEQQKIAEFLTSVDKLLESKQQQIVQAETWKKGLMQKLFV